MNAAILLVNCVVNYYNRISKEKNLGDFIYETGKKGFGGRFLLLYILVIF